MDGSGKNFSRRSGKGVAKPKKLGPWTSPPSRNLVIPRTFCMRLPRGMIQKIHLCQGEKNNLCQGRKKQDAKIITIPKFTLAILKSTKSGSGAPRPPPRVPVPGIHTGSRGGAPVKKAVKIHGGQATDFSRAFFRISRFFLSGGGVPHPLLVSWRPRQNAVSTRSTTWRHHPPRAP